MSKYIFMLYLSVGNYLQMVKLQQVKDRYFISIPKEFIAQTQLKKGDILTCSYNERGNLEFKKVIK